jgi:hypothetical protein
MTAADEIILDEMHAEFRTISTKQSVLFGLRIRPEKETNATRLFWP